MTKKKTKRKLKYDRCDREACERDGYHIWSYDQYGKPKIGDNPRFESEDLSTIEFSVECVRCDASVVPDDEP